MKPGSSAFRRSETPDPARSDAVNRRFQGVRQRTDRHDQQELTRNTVLVVPMGLACIARSRRLAGRAIAQGRLAGRARGGNTSGDNLVVM